MILKSSLAALLAAGLIVPEKPKLIFPKPAIVRADSLELSKHMLAMPLTMGLLSRKSANPYYISSSTGGVSNTAETLSWTHTTTADTTCLVVGQTVVKSGADAGTSTVTFNGVALTQIVEATYNANNQATRLFRLFNPPVGSFTLSVQISGTIDRGHCAQALNLGGANAVSGSTFDVDTGASAVLSSTVSPIDRAIIVAQGYAKHTTSGTIPGLTFSAPSGTLAPQSSTDTFNTLGTRISLFYSPLQAAGTITCTMSTNVNVTPIMFAVAAFIG
jgi:hypothetical protein